MPTGYSFNLDGSTLYLAVASIFVAQAAGIHLGLGQQLVMMLTLMLTSKGVAAVPARLPGDSFGNPLAVRTSARGRGGDPRAEVRTEKESRKNDQGDAHTTALCW